MNARTVFAWLLVAVLAVITWLIAKPFLSWLLAAGFLAFVLHPVHCRLKEQVGKRISAALLTALVVLVLVIPLAVGIEAAVSEGSRLLERLSKTNGLQQLERLVERYTGLTIPIHSFVQGSADRFANYASDRASTVVGAGLHAFLGFLLLTFVLYYLLADGERFVAWLKRMTPLDADVRNELFASANSMVWAVLKGHVLVAIVQGAVAGVSLVVTGVPYALALTVAMMVLAVVPIIGVSPVLGGAVVYLFANGQPLSAAFVVVWGMTTVAITDDYLRALFIDHESEMHSAVVFVGLTGGTYLLGAIGIFVGPILVALFKTTVEVLGDHYGVVHAPER